MFKVIIFSWCYLSSNPDEGCGPPKCLYQKNEIPGGLDASETPMLVYMSFDDAITPSTFSMYQILFLNAATQAKNPNGCPHRATFFVSNQYTKYEDVQTLYNANHEIASHSVNHITMKSILKEKQRSEMAGQRDVIMEKTGIPAHDIRGVRSPYLAIGGDRFYDMLEEEHFQYDASMTSISQNPIWPHTMHYGSTGYCNSASQECPQSDHSLWQVPLNAYWHRSQLQCAMLDGCRPKDANETFDFIWENFQRHYNSPERPPFGLNLHATWFIGWHHTLVGFRMFLEKIQEMDDVWVAPICEIINWIKTPVGLSNLTTSHHFQC